MGGELQNTGTETQQNKPNIESETPQRMFELIRMCHPDEHGEPYYRGEVLEEFRRRGKEIFEALGWPTGDDSIYKNRYTGGEDTLKNVCFDPGNNFRKAQMNFWSAMGDWWPVDLWVADSLLGDYKSKPKLSSFFPELK